MGERVKSEGELPTPFLPLYPRLPCAFPQNSRASVFNLSVGSDLSEQLLRPKY